MKTLATVLFDEAHRQAWTTRGEVAALMNPANPADVGYTQAAATLAAHGLTVVAHAAGELTPATLAEVDVLVLPHCSTDE